MSRLKSIPADADAGSVTHRLRCLRARLGALARREEGLAIPTVMIVMVIGLGFASVAVTISANSQGETQRDQKRKAALAIADAGAQRAQLTYNKITTSAANPCVVKTGSGSSATLTTGPIPAATSPFCAPIGGSGDSDAKVGTKGGYFTYWVNPCVDVVSGTGCSFVNGATPVKRMIKIVSQGYQQAITRRVSVAASGYRGQLANTTAKAIGLDSFTMSGWSELEVDAATNGDFVMQRSGGCPGTGSDADGVNDNDPLNVSNGCPRVCLGDWYTDLKVTVGAAPKGLSYPSGTQGCTLHDPNNAKNPKPNPGSPNAPENFKPRVNPPGKPEVGTLNSPDQITSGQYADPSAQQVSVINSGNLTLAPVDTSSVNPTGNARLALINQTGGDTSTGPGTINWNSSTRTLTMNGTGDLATPLRLNIGGGDYSLCKLVMTGYSQLIMAAQAQSRFFIDSPEDCGLSGNPVVQLSVHDYSRIGSATYDSLNYDPTKPNDLANQAKLALLSVAMVGSEGTGSSFIPTKADFQIPVTYPDGAVNAQQLKLYAPRTAISLDTGYSRENEGWFVGKTLAMIHGSEIESNPSMPAVGAEIVPPDFVLFTRDTYVECGPAGVAIDAHC